MFILPPHPHTHLYGHPQIQTVRDTPLGVSYRHTTYLFDSRENRQNCCQQRSDFKAKMHQIQFRLGLYILFFFVGAQIVKVSYSSMPVLRPAVASSPAFTLPVPLEPDIEHLRRRHGNTTTSLCFALIGQLKPSSSSSSSSLLSLSHLNCSFSDPQVDNDEVTWWLQQLALGTDPVHYVLPVVLIVGIVCDTFSVWLLARLLLLRTPTRCHGDVVTSDVYLLWLTVTSDLWLVCAAVRALPDYVSGHVTESMQWADGYAAAVGEWFSYTCLWLLLTMSLNAAVCLSARNNRSPVRSEHHRQNSENSLNHTYHHHHHRFVLVVVVVVVVVPLLLFLLFLSCSFSFAAAAAPPPPSSSSLPLPSAFSSSSSHL